jgi:hypothetical protein
MVGKFRFGIHRTIALADVRRPVGRSEHSEQSREQVAERKQAAAADGKSIDQNTVWQCICTEVLLNLC